MISEWLNVTCLPHHRSMLWTSSGLSTETLVWGKTLFPSSQMECRLLYLASPLLFGQWVFTSMFSTCICLCCLNLDRLPCTPTSCLQGGISNIWRLWIYCRTVFAKLDGAEQSYCSLIYLPVILMFAVLSLLMSKALTSSILLPFTFSVYQVRNSSTLLFSTLITRIFGVKKGKDEHSKKNRSPAFPSLTLQFKFTVMCIHLNEGIANQSLSVTYEQIRSKSPNYDSKSKYLQTREIQRVEVIPLISSAVSLVSKV